MPTAARTRRSRQKAVEKAYRSIMADPQATAADRLSAANGLARLQERRDRVARKAEAAEQETPKPAPAIGPEEMAEVMAEYDRRTAAHDKAQHAFVAARKAYFDAHPDRAGEVMKAIGAKEFLRITTVPE